MSRSRALPLCALFVLAPVCAFADATLFLGSTSTPTSRGARGGALGVGLVVVGFEVEYAVTTEDPSTAAPGLRTGMGNLLVQTPVAIARMRPYLTAGGGVYRERLGTSTETQIAANSGGGVKISLAGPLRARLDYRVFKLRGSPRHSTVHRLYAGANLSF
jgi:hypothetical protein